MTPRVDPFAVFNRIASEVYLTGPDAFAHVPAALPWSPSAPIVVLDPSAPLARSPLPEGLAHFLYAHYYLQDSNEVENGRNHALSQIPIRAREDAAFGQLLRAANRGRGYVDLGWVVTGRSNGGTLANKNGITLFLTDRDIVGPSGRVRDSRPLAAGTPIGVRFPNDRPYACPGFYTAEGDGGPATPEGGRAIVRIYFAVRPDYASALLSAMTETCGRTLSRFSFKLLNNPRWYTRPDAAVAYVHRSEYPLAHRMLRDVVLRVREGLIDRYPALTFPIARGVAVADEPHAESAFTRQSFGFHRSELIARGLVRAYAAGSHTPDGRLAWLLREFRAAGLDPSRPWLNPGSSDFRPLDVEEDPTASASTRGASLDMQVSV